MRSTEVNPNGMGIFFPFCLFFPSPNPQDVGLAMLRTPGAYGINYCCRKEWILKHVLEKVHGSEISQDPLSVMVIPGWGLNAKTTESALGMPSPVIKTRGKLIFFFNSKNFIFLGAFGCFFDFSIYMESSDCRKFKHIGQY